MRKICWKIHRWLSIPLGVFMSILCFTGLILLFGKEIASAFGQDSRQMPFLVAIRQLHRWLLMVPETIPTADCLWAASSQRYQRWP